MNENNKNQGSKNLPFSKSVGAKSILLKIYWYSCTHFTHANQGMKKSCLALKSKISSYIWSFKNWLNFNSYWETNWRWKLTPLIETNETTFVNETKYSNTIQIDTRVSSCFDTFALSLRLKFICKFNSQLLAILRKMSQKFLNFWI